MLILVYNTLLKSVNNFAHLNFQTTNYYFVSSFLDFEFFIKIINKIEIKNGCK